MDTMEYYLNSCAESTSLLEGRIPNNDIYNYKLEEVLYFEEAE